jgi:transcriptional regulator with XRE-family HTH domain
MALTPTRRRKVVVWMIVKDPTKLRRRRRDKHLSQVQLAALVGCTQQYISLMETGIDRDCTEKIAERICRYLDVDLEDFFEERRVVSGERVATVSRGSGTGTAA